MRVILVAALLVGMVAVAGTEAPPAMPTDPETGMFQYQEVIVVEGATADDLFARARAFAQTYRSAKAVTDVDDPAAHRFAVVGNFDVNYLTATLSVEHKLTIETKDGRYRYNLGNFRAFWPNGDYRTLNDKWVINTKIVPRTAEKCEVIIAALKAAMSQPPKEW